MDAAAEALMRSMIHDLANTLSGIHGILEVQDPTAPLSQRTRSRLDAVLQEGLTTLERSRHLAMGTLPSVQPEPGAPWRRRLLERLGPLGTMFGCHFELTHEGEGPLDHWPGEEVLGFTLAMTRQVLPYALGTTVTLHLAATPETWTLRWGPLGEFPEGLRPGEHPRDISARWVLTVADHLGIECQWHRDLLEARIPRLRA